MLTEFGKLLRKTRIDNNEILKDMADLLNVTVSYLSAVENGKRDVPEKWISILSGKYPELDYQVLMELAAKSNKTLKINMEEMNKKDRSIFVSFARKFDELNEDEKRKILEVLTNDKEE